MGMRRRRCHLIRLCCSCCLCCLPRHSRQYRGQTSHGTGGDHRCEQPLTLREHHHQHDELGKQGRGHGNYHHGGSRGMTFRDATRARCSCCCRAHPPPVSLPWNPHNPSVSAMCAAGKLERGMCIELAKLSTYQIRQYASSIRDTWMRHLALSGFIGDGQPSASVPTEPAACVPAASCSNSSVFLAVSSSTEEPTPST